jgi:hypothetical protein
MLCPQVMLAEGVETKAERNYLIRDKSDARIFICKTRIQIGQNEDAYCSSK